MSRHAITEHHHDLRTRRRWSVLVGTATSARRAISTLADRRRASDIPETLTHWTVGTHSVVAQSAWTLSERQGVGEASR